MTLAPLNRTWVLLCLFLRSCVVLFVFSHFNSLMVHKNCYACPSCPFLARVLSLLFKVLHSRMGVHAVRYDLFSVVVLFHCLNIFILPLPLLGLGSKSTSLSLGFCVSRPWEHDTICLWLIIFLILRFFLVDCLSGRNQWMWLMSCRRQGVLSQEHGPDPLYK